MIETEWHRSLTTMHENGMNEWMHVQCVQQVNLVTNNSNIKNWIKTELIAEDGDRIFHAPL